MVNKRLQTPSLKKGMAVFMVDIQDSVVKRKILDICINQEEVDYSGPKRTKVIFKDFYVLIDEGESSYLFESKKDAIDHTLMFYKKELELLNKNPETLERIEKGNYGNLSYKEYSVLLAMNCQPEQSIKKLMAV